MSQSRDGSFPIHDALQHVVEAALANEETISKSAGSLQQTAEALKQQTSLLRMRTAQEVERAASSAASAAARNLTEELRSVLGTAEKARISYEQAVQFSFWRVALHTLICSLAGVGAMVATAWFIIPDANKMQALREEKAQLEGNIAALNAQGGRIRFSHCGERLCVRTDETSRANLYGDPGETYRIIYGY